MKQLLHRGKPTAKSILFDLWESEFDDTDIALAADLDISPATVRSYRVEWKARRGEGVKELHTIMEIDPDSLPLETSKGWVWRVPIRDESKRLKCGTCECRMECWEWTRRQGYLGCEEVFESELLPERREK